MSDSVFYNHPGLMEAIHEVRLKGRDLRYLHGVKVALWQMGYEELSGIPNGWNYQDILNAYEDWCRDKGK